MQALSILIIDDETDILEICKDAFEFEGHFVNTFEDAELALKEIQSKEYDIIISDEKMPKVSGTQVFKIIKESMEQVPSFFLSTGDFTVDSEKLVDEGMSGVLIKPYDIELLVEFVLEKSKRQAS